jgi:hypothetical protein
MCVDQASRARSGRSSTRAVGGSSPGASTRRSEFRLENASPRGGCSTRRRSRTVKSLLRQALDLMQPFAGTGSGRHFDLSGLMCRRPTAPFASRSRSSLGRPCRRTSSPASTATEKLGAATVMATTGRHRRRLRLPNVDRGRRHRSASNHFWQNFPKSPEGVRTTQVRIGLWPDWRSRPGVRRTVLCQSERTRTSRAGSAGDERLPLRRRPLEDPPRSKSGTSG